jgi:hypothetical protein
VEDRSTSGSERRDTGNFLTTMTVGKLGVMLLVGGVVAFLCGLFEVFGSYHRRENDLLTDAGGIPFLVGVVLVAVSLHRKGKV